MLRAAAIGLAVLGAAYGRPAEAATACTPPDARIVVDTQAHRLSLCEKDREVAAFSVRLGRGGVGKTTEGDHKTPLGVYPLGAARKSERYGLFIPVGYPTPDERRRGYTGGDIGIHGPPRWVGWMGSPVNSFDLSNGCVVLATDAEMARIAAWVRTAGARTVELR
jgi:murein L,D-transpeptidase YafK